MPVQHLKIAEEDAGQRLDNYLLRILKGVPRSMIYRIVRSGEVRVNSGRVKVGYRLASGDTLRVPPVRTAGNDQAPVPKPTASRLAAAIIYEDDGLLAINKPAGIAVHGGSGVAFGVVEALRQHLANPRLELVHRLDRDTSGVLLLAKKRSALRDAQAQFRQRSVGKHYELLVYGQWLEQHTVAQERLLRTTTSSGERRVRVDAAGQQARTDFRLIQASTSASRLSATLHTGRTHQIRVHVAVRGHPIIGDDKYDRSADQRPVAAGRMCLHARKLVLRQNDQALKLEVSPPPDFEQVWDQFHTA